MSTEKPDDKLSITENPDGTAVISGIEPAADDAPADERLVKQAEGNPAGPLIRPEGGTEGADGDDSDHPDDDESVRAAKRERRRKKRELARATRREKDAMFSELQRQNAELMARLERVEGRSVQTELAQVDKALEDEQVRVQYARMKIAEATKSQDGEAMAAAQDALYEARRNAEYLETLRRQMTGGQKRPAGDTGEPAQAAQPRTAIPDPGVQREAAAWLGRNNWYDPGRRDTDSKIAYMIDQELTAEGGFDPGTPEYWDELDDRLRERLPHRYTPASNPDKALKSNAGAPRSVMTGSGRESAAAAGGSSRRTFTLTREQVAAMKEAGMWDDPAKRANMIRRYQAEHAKRQGASQ